MPQFDKHVILSSIEIDIRKPVIKYFTNTVKLYSTALFEYALEQKKIVALSEDFLKLKNIFVQDSSVIENIAAPVYSKNEQTQLLSAILGKLNLSSEMNNFLQVLLENKRLKLLPLIAGHFDALAHEHSGNKIVEVTLVDEAYLAQKKEIIKQLENIFSSKMDVSFKQDKEILAGIIIKTDNKMFDASLRTKFANLTDSITKKIALL